MPKKKIAFVVTSFFCLLFFVYMLFPYSLVKDVIVGEIQTYLNDANTGITVRSGPISSYWFTGIRIQNFEISDRENPRYLIKFDDITLRLSVLPLLWGDVTITSHIHLGQGKSSAETTLSLWQLLNQKAQIIRVLVTFQRFPLDTLFSQGIQLLKESDSPSLSLLTPVFENTIMGGFLNGDIQYRARAHKQSKLDLDIYKGFLDLQNETLEIPKQNFSKAHLGLTYQDGLWTIQPNTALLSQNIEMTLQGTLQKEHTQYVLNSNLKAGLSGQLEKNFGFLVPQVLNCASSDMVGGILNVKLTGTTDKIVCHQ